MSPCWHRNVCRDAAISRPRPRQQEVRCGGRCERLDRDGSLRPPLCPGVRRTRACPDMKFRGGEFSIGIDKCGEIPKPPHCTREQESIAGMLIYLTSVVFVLRSRASTQTGCSSRAAKLE